MTANTNSGTRSVSNGSLAVVVKLIGHIREPSTSTDGGLPRVGIHRKVLKMYEIDDEFAILSSNTCFLRVSSLSTARGVF